MPQANPIVLPLKFPGLNNLQKVQSQMEALERTYNKVPGATRKAEKGIAGVGNKAAKSTKQVSALTGAVRGLVTAAALIGTTKFIFAKTAELQTQTRSLEVLTGSVKEAKDIVKELQEIGTVTPFTSSELIESAKKLKAMNVDTEDLVETTSRLADISGATGARLGEVALAYGKVQSVGRLTGETLLQFAERGIDVQGELQKMYNLSGEEFRKALSKGQIGAKSLEVAIARLTDVGGKYADGAIAQSDTLAGRLSTLQDNIQRLAQNVGRILTPLFEWVINSSIDAINYINQLANQAAQIQGFGVDDQTRDSYWKKAGDEAEKLIRLRGQLDAMGNPDSKAFTTLRNEMFGDMLNQYGYENGKLQVEIEPVKAPGALSIPELLGNDGKGSGKGSSKSGASAASKAAKDAERLAQQTADRLLSAEKLVTAAQREGELLRANSDAEKAQIESMNAMMEIAEKYGELGIESLSRAETENLLLAQGQEINNERKKLEEKLADIRKSGIGAVEDEIAHMEAILAGTEKEYLLRKKIAELGGGPEAEAKVQRLEQLKLEVAAYEEMEAKIEGVANTIAGSMTDAFSSVIDGSKSAEEAMADMMKDIAKSFIDMAADIIKQQIAMIIKGLIMKALGISMPGATAPTPAMPKFGPGFEGGGYTGNAPRSGGVDGRGGFPAILHPQETVIDHTKAMNNYSGGNASAAAAAPMTANVTYSGPTLNFNGDDYIPRSEANNLVAAGAKQGQARTLATLKNSRSQRSKLGM